MCGYPALYVEGYAVPPSAFHLTENGEYEAAVDGTMGHAWCMVYDEKTKCGISGNIPRALREQQGQKRITGSGSVRCDTGGNIFPYYAGRIILTVFPILAGAAGILAILYIQAAVRRGGRKRRWPQERRRRYLYYVQRDDQNGCTGRKRRGYPSAVSRKTLSSLKSACPEITEDDWEWHMTVL